ncbi:MAG: guanylate kinase [Candidatus Omnitrophota bacterium]|nr:guanylate kinase [Candidatus Omnitrophota bacterium]
MNKKSEMAQGGKSLIVVVSAPSGSGKTTIVSRLLEKAPDMKRSVSCTTRQPREGEKTGIDYIFVSEEEFKERIEKRDFLEWEKIFSNYYGTPRDQVTEAIEQGVDIILSIDIRGARSIKGEFPESVGVFIMPPSFEELETRIKRRDADRGKQVSIRLQESGREIAAADEYDYLIINDDLDRAVEELKTIIEAEKDNRKRNIKKDKE